MRWRFSIWINKNKLLDNSNRIPIRFKHDFSISLLHLLPVIKISIQQDLWINMLQFLIYQLVREWQPSGSNFNQIPMLSLRKWSLSLKINKFCCCADRLRLGYCCWWPSFTYYHNYFNWGKYWFKYWHYNNNNNCQIRRYIKFDCPDFNYVCVTFISLINLIIILRSVNKIRKIRVLTQCNLFLWIK